MPDFPKTRSDWQKAMDLAFCTLIFRALFQAGLISDFPGFPPERCAELLREGISRGYRPSKEASTLVIEELITAGKAAAQTTSK